MAATDIRTDRRDTTHPPCDARMDVGIVAVSITGAVAVVAFLMWWLG